EHWPEGGEYLHENLLNAGGLPRQRCQAESREQPRLADPKGIVIRKGAQQQDRRPQVPCGRLRGAQLPHSPADVVNPRPQSHASEEEEVAQQVPQEGRGSGALNIPHEESDKHPAPQHDAGEGNQAPELLPGGGAHRGFQMARCRRGQGRPWRTLPGCFGAAQAPRAPPTATPLWPSTWANTSSSHSPMIPPPPRRGSRP